MRDNLTGYVDAYGLHLRWGRGGLNLRRPLHRDAEKIVMALPARAAELAA